MIDLPISKSFFAAPALARLVETAYGLGPIQCHLISATMRDVYLMNAGQQRYIFYVYRAGRRTEEQITAEWQFVAYLAAQRLPVVPAMTTNDGALLLKLPAPEGTRYGVLTPFLEGRSLRSRSSRATVLAFGRQVARLHQAADTLALPLNRPAIGLATLVEQASAALASVAYDQPDVVARFQKAAARVCALLPDEASEAPEYGLVHGDVIRANALVADDGAIAIIDFDLCGYGWRAYDVASYLSAIRGADNEAEFEAAFLAGYQELRPLSAWKQSMLPVFEAARTIYVTGLPAIEVDLWGSSYFNSYLNSGLEQLEQTMRRIEEQRTKNKTTDN